jgi:hypothetical protein
MKNNKLTLKTLKQELENLKSHNAESNANKTKSNELKHSYVNRLYMQSSALWLYLITGLLGYVHKIPLLVEYYP